MTTSLAQQAKAIETARRILKGARVKPRGAEMEFLDGQLADAERTTRLFSVHEDKIRAVVGVRP